MSLKDLQPDASQQAIARWENEGGALNPFPIETSSPQQDQHGSPPVSQSQFAKRALRSCSDARTA